ncbi:universal stress protein [Halobacteria archaeon AArc-curdl1]|uniref:Universal stress protein n=1 Tax=Natronosalvus hydrolyticus TaxID=2979988 RepID=A0AAP2Z6C0_9EURY|nr:universal stress protein [Halobacteria archaeon AArc-curdl1]
MVILAAIDEPQGSNPVISVAHDLASAYETNLHVVHVSSEADFKSRQKSVSDIDDFREYSKAQARESTANMARKAVDETLDGDFNNEIVTVGRVGDPVQSILDVAADIDAEYIVIGGQKRSPTGKALFGSTTQSILLTADRPVVTVMKD